MKKKLILHEMIFYFIKYLSTFDNLLLALGYADNDMSKFLSGGFASK